MGGHSNGRGGNRARARASFRRWIVHAVWAAACLTLLAALALSDARLYEAAERWRELIDVLRQRIDIASSEAEAVGLLSRIAEERSVSKVQIAADGSGGFQYQFE